MRRRPSATWMKSVVRRLRGDFWPLPTACVVLAGALALALVQVDEALERGGTRFAFTGGPDSARSLLSTIATSMLTLTALVFSITIVVLQLASSQFSPRTLRTFLRDRQSQLALGTFLATFVYALVALREIRGADGLADRFVPGVTITGAFALVMLSVALFVQYIHHVAQSIRVSTIIERVGAETRRTIERVHVGEDATEEPAPAFLRIDEVVTSDRHGTVVSVDVAQLVAVARASDVVLRVVPCVGQFVVTGTPLVEVAGGSAPPDEVRRAVALGTDRSAHQDVAFGLRQLVDIAGRALSPGINDPSTAVQCLDAIHELLRALVHRSYPSPVHCDEHGVPRAVLRIQTWDDHVALALDEIRHWGADAPQVRSRMQALVDDLLSTAEGDRRRPLRRRLPLWPAHAEGSRGVATTVRATPRRSST